MRDYEVKLPFADVLITIVLYAALGVLFLYLIYFPTNFGNFLFFNSIPILATELITMTSTAFIFQFFFGYGTAKSRTLKGAAAFLSFFVVVGLLAIALKNYLLLFYFLLFSLPKIHAYKRAMAAGGAEMSSIGSRQVIRPLIQFVAMAFTLLAAFLLQIIYLFSYLFLTTLNLFQQANVLMEIANFFGNISWGDLATVAGGQTARTQVLMPLYNLLPYAPRTIAAVLGLYFFIVALLWAWPYIRKAAGKDFRANLDKLETEHPEELKAVREGFRAKAQRYENQQYKLFGSAAPEAFNKFLKCKDKEEKARLFGSLMNQIKVKNPKEYEESIQMLKDLGNEFERKLNTLAKNTRRTERNSRPAI